MKILFYIGGLGKGGAERVISNLSNYLIKENEITIMTDFNRKSKYALNEKINIVALDKDDTIQKLKIINNFKRLKKISRVIESIKPDVIISFLPLPSYRVLLLKRKIKTPIIVSVRNDPNAEYNNFIKKIIMKLLYRRANGFVFQTKEAQKFFSKKIQKKSVVIPNPIKNEFIERKIYEGERENIIVSVGRLEEQKNFELLIHAFYDISKDIEDYKLIIYGEGSLRHDLEKKINGLNMHNRIFLPGNVDNVAEKIEKAKLFVMTSDYEGMPNALMEAMALGIVCISTNCPCGGPRFLINDKENGFLFELNDKEHLKELMKEVLLNKEDNLFQISEKAKKRMQDFKEEKISKLWIDFIENVINKKNTKEDKDIE